MALTHWISSVLGCSTSSNGQHGVWIVLGPVGVHACVMQAWDVPVRCLWQGRTVHVEKHRQSDQCQTAPPSSVAVSSAAHACDCMACLWLVSVCCAHASWRLDALLKLFQTDCQDCLA